MEKRAFIYIRVSTREQAQEGYSLGEQEERLKKYCEAMEWTVTKVFTDGGYTGSNMERPALQEMIKEIKKGNADIVLVDKLDRLSRSQFDTLYLIKKVFNEYNCAFVSRAESFDTSSSFGRAMVGILAVFAELERERIKERMKEGKEGRAKEGKYKGGVVPIGYSYDSVTGTLIVNKYEAMQVKEAFQLFLKGHSINSIAKILNEKGYRHKYGSYKKASIDYMFKNTVCIYAGYLKYNGEIYKGQHEPIIDEETFQEIQKKMKERDRNNEKYKIGHRYSSILGGLIWCGHCGGKYGWFKNGRGSSYYMCYSRSKSSRHMVKDPNCKNKSYRSEILEEIILNEISKLKSDTSYIDKLHESVDTAEKQTEIQKRVETLESQISKMMDLYSLGGIDFEVVKVKIETLQLEKKSLLDELEDIEIEQQSMSKEKVIELVDAIEMTKQAGDNKTLNAIIKELIDYIVIEGEEIVINWAF